MPGSIASLQATMYSVLNWQASKTDALLGTRSDNNQLALSIAFQNASTATYIANQCKVIQISVPAGSTTTVDLSEASANIVEDATATFDRIFAALVWLPSTTQHSLGSSASSVTVGKASSARANLFGLHDGSSALKLFSGESRGWQTPQMNGYAIHANQKNLLLTNNDSSNAATVLLGMIGSDIVYPQVDFSNSNDSMYWLLGLI